MRAACTENLTLIHADWQRSQTRAARQRGDDSNQDPFILNYFITIGRLRAAVGQQLSTLQEAYGLSIDGELARIMPGDNEDVELEYRASEQGIEEAIDAVRRRTPGLLDSA